MTALLFFPLVGWQLANHRMPNAKVFISLQKSSKIPTFGLWLTGLTSYFTMGT